MATKLEGLLLEALQADREAHIHRRICGKCDTISLEFGEPGCPVYAPKANDANQKYQEAMAWLMSVERRDENGNA